MDVRESYDSAAAAYAEHLRPQPGMALIDWMVRYTVDLLPGLWTLSRTLT